jgi:hypothetical protein
MQVLDVCRELTLLRDIKVEFVPIAQGSQFGTGESGQRAEKKSCNNEITQVTSNYRQCSGDHW